MRRTEREQLLGECVVGINAGHRLHHGLHLFAEIGIRDAEHGSVSNLRVRDEQVLRFLGIDVHAAGNDHEGLPVSEVQEAIVVEIADVVHRCHGPVRRGRFLRLRGVVVVFEGRRGLEPDRARVAVRHRLHIVIKDVEDAEHHASHGTLVRQPLFAVAGREAQALGGAVVLLNDRPPPLDHLLLHLHRTGCGGVDNHFERREIVGRARCFGQFQQATEHGRHELAVGDAIVFDQAEVLLRIEAFHDDDRTAAANREIAGGLRCRVIQRRRRQVDHVVAVVPESVEKCVQRQRFGGGLLGHRPHDAFRAARGA